MKIEPYTCVVKNNLPAFSATDSEQGEARGEQGVWEKCAAVCERSIEDADCQCPVFRRAKSSPNVIHFVKKKNKKEEALLDKNIAELKREILP